MKLVSQEYRKLWKNRLTTVLVIFLLLVHGAQFIFISQQNSADQYRAIDVYFTDVAQRQADLAYFQGEVTDGWTAKYSAEAEAIRNDPDNWVSPEEREAIRQAYRDEGFTDEFIAEISSAVYMREEVITSHEYYKYEEMEWASDWRQRGEDFSTSLQKLYLESFPGATGQIKAAQAAKDYAALTEEAPQYFDDDLGWWKYRGMHDSYLLIVGVAILVGLSGMFAGEYAAGTDALIQSSKYGKGRLARAKLAAGCLFALTVWAAAEAIDLMLTTAFFGWQGANTFWQNWYYDWAPWNTQQWQVSIWTVATSCFGAVTMAMLIMAASSTFRRPVTALVIGAFCMVFPLLNIRFGSGCGFWWFWNLLFPSRMLQGVYLWQIYEPVVLFGKAVPIQAVLLVLAAVLGALCAWFACRRFCRHQVEN